MASVIIRPIITEKSMHKAAESTFTFVVARTADKKAVKQAVEKQFGVNVIKVVTSMIKGRTQRTGMRRIEVKKSPFKKAAVTLKDGQKIAMFDIAA